MSSRRDDFEHRHEGGRSGSGSRQRTRERSPPDRSRRHGEASAYYGAAHPRSRSRSLESGSRRLHSRPRQERSPENLRRYYISKRSQQNSGQEGNGNFVPGPAKESNEGEPWVATRNRGYSSSSDSDDEEHRRRRQREHRRRRARQSRRSVSTGKKSDAKQKKRKKGRNKSTSTSSSSSSSSISSESSSSSSSDSETEKKRKKKAKKKKSRTSKKGKKHAKEKKPKKLEKKKSVAWTRPADSSDNNSIPSPLLKRPVDVPKVEEEMIGPVPISDPVADSKRLAPMTQEEFDKRQSVIRREVSPTTGRSRLIKGDGEVIEEMVSRTRHKEINRLATRADGQHFQEGLKKIL